MSCFWGHHWGKWERRERSFTGMCNFQTGQVVTYPTARVEHYQERVCKVCGKIQQEELNNP